MEVIDAAFQAIFQQQSTNLRPAQPLGAAESPVATACKRRMVGQFWRGRLWWPNSVRPGEETPKAVKRPEPSTNTKLDEMLRYKKL